jgi:hypothetical protein
MALVDDRRVSPWDDLKLVVKDGLRGVRYLLRHSPPRALPRPPGLGHVRDSLVAGLGAAVTRLRGGERPRPEAVRLALERFARLAAQGPVSDLELEFRKASYALAKAILGLRGLDNALVAEHSLAAAAHSPLADGPFADGAEFCAAAALALHEAQPVTRIDADAAGSDDPFLRSPNVALACTIGLAATAWIAKAGKVDAEKLLMSAVEVVVPLHERLLGEIGGPHPRASLASLFREYAAFIP